MSGSRPRGRPGSQAPHQPVPHPSIEHLRTVHVAGTGQLVAYFRALVATGMRYFIVECGQDAEALQLLAEEVAPHLHDAA